MEAQPVKIRCKSKERAAELMYMARRFGIDSVSRGAVLTISACCWMGGIVEKFEILANN